jgi:hypothetical protein
MFIAGVNDTGEKLFSGVNDTGKKFIASVVDTADFLSFFAGVVDTADKHSFAIISVNFRKNLKRSHLNTQRPGGP